MVQTETQLIGASTAIRELEHDIKTAARSNATVLITGESGVGKEIAAQSIHRQSLRAQRQIVTINCAGIPDSLLESELFGHVRGSFTGAYRDRIGRLEVANGGTVFLDEVGEMSLHMQALLLRFLETGEIQRVGASGIHAHVDVRVLAATNRDLTASIASREFREDLYYRLNVIRLSIPPLRERREDIPVLLRHFCLIYAERHRLEVPDLPPDVLAKLMAYGWPGNVRELKNIVERLILRTRSGAISPADLPAEIRTVANREPGPTETTATSEETESLWVKMVQGGETFWSAVYPRFMSRDLTRSELRQIILRGLQRTAGSYKILAQLFNIAPGEYKRFLSFLYRHGCDARLYVVRPVKDRYPSTFPLLASADDRPRRKAQPEPAACPIDPHMLSDEPSAVGCTD